jgi:hypothetical protein
MAPTPTKIYKMDPQRILTTAAAGFALIAIYFLLRDRLDKIFHNIITHSKSNTTPDLTIPSAELTKTWQQDNAIIASLHVACSGNNTKEALQGVETLLTLSASHDDYCLQTKDIKKGREVG